MATVVWTLYPGEEEQQSTKWQNRKTFSLFRVTVCGKSGLSFDFWMLGVWLFDYIFYYIGVNIIVNYSTQRRKNRKIRPYHRNVIISVNFDSWFFFKLRKAWMNTTGNEDKGFSVSMKIYLWDIFHDAGYVWWNH